MKRILIFSVLSAFIALGFAACGNAEAATSGNKTTTSFFTDGVCGMCEARIEKALLVKGVHSVSWDKQTKTTTVVYNPEHITEMQLHELAAKIGHDTDKVKATEEAYNKLPGCCRYKELETH